MSHRITNSALRLTFSDAATLTSLVETATGHDYAGGRPVWRLFVERGQRYQDEAFPLSTPPQVTAVSPTELRFDYPALVSKTSGELALRLSFGVRLIDDETHWWAELHNATADVTVKDFQFPLLGAMRLKPDQGLITTYAGGQRHPDAKQFVRNHYPPTHHHYVTTDHEAWQAQLGYPGLTAAFNCFTLPAADSGLYFGSHDTTFRDTIHLWRLDGPAKDDFEAGFAKHLALRPGESIRLDGYVVSAYAGTWHVAADKYRAWAETWFKPAPRPEWLRGFNGWQRLILKHQDGTVQFPYDSFPQIFADGAKAGVKGLFMFGWWPGGMDRQYPDYRPDPELGGEAALRTNVRRFQNSGGQVILYSSGRLVDMESAFYKTKGRRLAIKTRSGEIRREYYNFGNASSYTRANGTVELSPMCLDCAEWIDVLKGIIDQAADYGCKGVFFDQLGLTEHPCHDPSHGHPVPYLTSWATKRRICGELRDYARSLDPQMAIGVEVFADANADQFDFVHGWYGQSFIARNTDYQAKGERPQYPAFVDWLRYTFPGVLISDRDIRDGTDVERRVNLALLLGLLSDVEIYRCRKTIAEVPHYQAWLGEVNALRARHPDLLSPENYRDTLGFTVDNPEVEARAFVHGDKIGVLLTQSHLPETAVHVKLSANGAYAAHDGIGGARVTPGRPATVALPRHAVALVIFTLTAANP
jgi:hypothetical protein